MAFRLPAALALRRSVLPVLSASRPALRQLQPSRAASVTAADTSGRTPERTAELERLAEEHNGFMFGEVVRVALANPCTRRDVARNASLCARALSADLLCPLLPWLLSLEQMAKAGSGRTGNTHTLR
jgi:hypothetical protein